VITQVPPVAKEINQRGAGCAVPYEAEALANAFIRLLTDEDYFIRCREEAHAMAQDYTWEKIYDKLLLPLCKNK